MAKIALSIAPSITEAKKRRPLLAGISEGADAVFEAPELLALFDWPNEVVPVCLAIAGGVGEKLLFPHSGQMRIVGIKDLPQPVQ
jgi:hypothetical protein